MFLSVPKSDRRLKLIEDHSGQEVTDTLWEQDEDDETEQTSTNPDNGPRRNSTCLPENLVRLGQAKANEPTSCAERIERMSKDQLVEFVINLVQQYPEIGRKIEEEEELKAGRVTKIVRSIRAEIEDLTSEPAWRNSLVRRREHP